MPFVHHPIRALVAAALVAGGLACASDTRAGASDSGASAARAGRESDTAVRDDFGDTLPTGLAPRRIVSLNPATTELFFALGAGDRVVGRTEYDLYPKEAQAIPALGGGMRPNVEAVLGVRPDLVVLYASNENRNAAERFRAAGVATLSLRVDRIEHFRRAVARLGRILGDTTTARIVVDSVDRTLSRVTAATSGRPRPATFWKAWDSPVIAIGGGSFLTELVEIAGGRNIYGDDARPSLDVSIEDVVRRDPDVVLAGPESAARMRAAPAWQALRAVRDGRVLVVDTTLVGRPGIRLGEAAVSLARLLHPGAVQ
jgi:iron complex transport system substrate-binding protein